MSEKARLWQPVTGMPEPAVGGKERPPRMLSSGGVTGSYVSFDSEDKTKWEGMKKWWGEDSNLRRLRRQIYSLFPLAAREPHHTA